MRLGLVFTIALLLFVGCDGPHDEIRSYTVPKPDQAQPAANVEPPASGPQKMLAAIVPAEDQAWFFKVTGPADEIAKVEESFAKYLQTIRVDGAAATWKTPEGWLEKPASGMRQATLVIPTTNPPSEVSVIRLGQTTDNFVDYVRSNVNRWRDQMGLEPVEGETLKELVEKSDNPNADVYAVNLTGTKPATMAGGPPFANAPFAGGASNRPPNLPAADNQNRSADPPRGSANFYRSKLPDGWARAASRPMTIAIYKTANEDAEVAVTSFGAVAAMVDRLENTNRWRGQLGLPPMAKEDLADVVKDIQVDGIDAARIALMSDDVTDAIIVAMVERDGMVWFFKLSGPKEAVKSQIEKYDQWLTTVEFDPPPPTQ